MYRKHEKISEPESEDVKVWRYMDFTKLMSIITSGNLHFTRSDKFEDPFEGSFPTWNVKRRESFETATPEIQVMMKERLQDMKRFVALNCWHLNEYESDAMWKLYLKSNEGIAIQSTYAKLKESLIDKEAIYLGLVDYIDYENDSIEPGDSLTPFFHKRKSFEHEREVRAAVVKLPNTNYTENTIDGGLSIAVDLSTLIERVYVSPTAPDWFANLVKKMLHEYDSNYEVVHSKLNDDPQY